MIPLFLHFARSICYLLCPVAVFREEVPCLFVALAEGRCEEVCIRRLPAGVVALLLIVAGEATVLLFMFPFLTVVDVLRWYVAVETRRA